MSKTSPNDATFFDLDDDDGWEDMPVVRETDEFASAAGGLDEEDQKKYHYQPQEKGSSHGTSNATGERLNVDAYGQVWRANAGPGNESEYTRLRMREEDDADEVHLRTRYLFDEDKAMTPLSQMQQTKTMLTEAQRIAYVGLCALTAKAMADSLRRLQSKDLKASVQSTELWSLKILGRLYYHMELATEEQKMIDNLGLHGVMPQDLAPALMTTHTIANPEYDPVEARRQEQLQREREEDSLVAESDDISEMTAVDPSEPPLSPSPSTPKTADSTKTGFQTTARVFEETKESQMPGVSTTLSSVDEKVTLDIRWTVLCDLFLILIADSVYDARSRVLLEQVALHLGLGWVDVVKFEQRVTEALEIQEGVEKMEQQDIIAGRVKAARKRRYVMMGLATLGGGLVIGLSAGLLAPVIGAGLGAALTTVGIGGTAGFLGGTAGAAVITTGGVLTGANIAGRGMARRTQNVRTFEILPLHNNKRVNAILTVPGFITGELDDVRLPFSVLDPIVGDVYSVLWEPEMIRETGGALNILTSEVLSQVGQTVLQATVMTALMSALQWPILLTKLGYLIDNPWSNALDRAKAAGGVLADVLIHRQLGVRPVTLIGFSLGARVIFYGLLELARQKAFGIVQDVIILGATLTASQKTWLQARSVVSGRFVNGFARNDWLLNYLFRATNAGLSTVAGLRPVDNVPGIENVDVTDKIAGHMSYRTFMPLILDQLGFPVSADHFDEPEEPDFEGERIVLREGEELPKKKGWFGRKKADSTSSGTGHVSRPPTAYKPQPASTGQATSSSSPGDDDDLPPREEPAAAAGAPPPYTDTVAAAQPKSPGRAEAAAAEGEEGDLAAAADHLPAPRAGFNLEAMKAIIETSGAEDRDPGRVAPPPLSVSFEPATASRPHSAPPLHPEEEEEGDMTPTREDLPPGPASALAGSSSSAFGAQQQQKMSMAFSRSLSLDYDVGVNPRDDEGSEGGSEGDLGIGTGGTTTSSAYPYPYSYSGTGTAPSSSRLSGPLPPLPPPSFADEADVWAPPRPLAAAPETLGFGSFGGSDRTLASFAPAASSSSASLAFGDASGAITSTSVRAEPDPWSFGGSEQKKTTSGYLSNPWSS